MLTERMKPQKGVEQGAGNPRQYDKHHIQANDRKHDRLQDWVLICKLRQQLHQNPCSKDEEKCGLRVETTHGNVELVDHTKQEAAVIERRDQAHPRHVVFRIQTQRLAKCHLCLLVVS